MPYFYCSNPLTSPEYELGTRHHARKPVVRLLSEATGPTSGTDLLGLRLAVETGPKCYGCLTLADEWNLPSASRTRARKEKWTPGQDQLIDASAYCGSLVGIPYWKVSDAGLKSMEIANIDVDADSELPYVWTLDGNRPGAGSLRQSLL